MEFKFKFHDLGEAIFVAKLLEEAARNHVRADDRGFDDRPELLRMMAGRLRRFVYDNSPKDDSDDIPF